MPPIRLARPRRVFVDSSVIIAASISAKGAARDLTLSAFRGDFQIRVSSLVLEETERNLTRKAPHALAAFQEFRDALLADEITDPDPELIARIESNVEAKDAPIVAAAVAAEADFLVTYDQKHLLRHKDRIKSSLGLTLVTPDLVLGSEP